MKRLIPTILLTLFFTCLAPSGAVYATPVNVNTANADTMAAALNGVGPKIALAIIEYRQANGDFESPSDLLKVKGIGPKILERNRGDILTENSTAEVAQD